MKARQTETSNNSSQIRGGRSESSRTLGQRSVRLALVTGLALMLWFTAPMSKVSANHDQMQLNSWGATRQIPDLADGGMVRLSADQIIDVVVLGDGFLASEKAAFFQQAQGWYDEYLSPNGERPFTFFSQAFRVRAIFNASSERASPGRDSYYRVNVSASCAVSTDPCAIAGGGWENASGTDNEVFRNRLFGSVDALSPAANAAQYPDTLTVTAPGAPTQAGVYSNLVVVMFVRADDGASGYRAPSGVTKLITNGARKLRLGFEAPKHEFGHAFAYLRDEYIDARGTDATLSNPTPQSVFSLSNLSYTNARCNLLWAHLAPGGRYNPNVYSPIGNLYLGGVRERGVWHSEYKCQMNGKHENYQCNVDSGDPFIDLRDRSRFCFWCEEVLTVRILEKTGQLRRSSDPSSILERGQVWFNLWKDTLRDRYYVRFDIPRLIAEKNACLGFGVCPNPSGDCRDSCNTTSLPACLLSCGIRELGNAIYVNSATGAPGNPGTRAAPLNTVPNAVARANEVCTNPRLVAIQPGGYPGPFTISQPATLIRARCSSVVFGN